MEPQFIFNPNSKVIGKFHAGTREMIFNLGNHRFKGQTENKMIKLLSIAFQHEIIHREIMKICVKRLKKENDNSWDITTYWMHPLKILNRDIQDKIVFKIQGIEFNKKGKIII